MAEKKPVPGEKPTPEPGIEPATDANSAAVAAYRHPIEGPPPAPEPAKES